MTQALSMGTLATLPPVAFRNPARVTSHHCSVPGTARQETPLGQGQLIPKDLQGWCKDGTPRPAGSPEDTPAPWTSARQYKCLQLALPLKSLPPGALETPSNPLQLRVGDGIWYPCHPVTVI